MKHALVDNSLSAVERQAKRMTMDEDHICCFGMVSYRVQLNEPLETRIKPMKFCLLEV